MGNAGRGLGVGGLAARRSPAGSWASDLPVRLMLLLRGRAAGAQVRTVLWGGAGAMCQVERCLARAPGDPCLSSISSVRWCVGGTRRVVVYRRRVVTLGRAARDAAVLRLRVECPAASMLCAGRRKSLARLPAAPSVHPIAQQCSIISAQLTATSTIYCQPPPSVLPRHPPADPRMPSTTTPNHPNLPCCLPTTAGLPG